MTDYFADLTSPDVAALRDGDRTPVLLLPVGAVEPHGPHAPLGTDAIISAGMCRRAADVLADDPGVRVLILPPLPYGVTRFAARFAGAVGVSPTTLHALVVDLCIGLVDAGLPTVVIVNNHFEPAHVGVLREAVDTVLAERGVRIGHVDLVRRHNAERLTAEFRSGECHAGRYETSLVLADRPELVDTERMWSLPRVPVNLVAAMGAGQHDFVAMGMDDAYCGSPAESTAAEGLSTFDILTELLVAVVRDTAARRPGR
ncbi:MAG TPA: creatininase family protein [Pseudonocardiaceae bacterium]|jgi:creatinine amidohydrolase|nr:creatininase family protein [Pseudonocardiaceae bacterium]